MFINELFSELRKFGFAPQIEADTLTFVGPREHAERAEAIVDRFHNSTTGRGSDEEAEQD